MNKKHGFTLIELLAVIVVLAIIALIATPIVTTTIKNAKKGSAEVSAQHYVKAVELAVSNSELNKKHIPDGTYTIDSEGNLTGTNLPNGKLEIEATGTKPNGGTIVIKNGQVTTESTMTVGDYDVKYDSTSKEYVATEKNNSTKTYTIKVNLTNVTGDSGNVTSITSKDIKSLKFTANSGYELPDSVTVSGATYTWDKETGTLTLSKITGDITVTISGIETIDVATTVYGWSNETINLNDTIDPSKYATDSTTLFRKYFLKYLLDKNNKVIKTYSCGTINNKEYCLTNGEYGYNENEENFTGNVLILKKYEKDGLNCNFNTYNSGFAANASSCYGSNIALVALSNNGVYSTNGLGGCEVNSKGSSVCNE